MTTAKLQALREAPLFSGLSEHQLEEIGYETELVTVDGGTQLLEQGRDAAHMWILVEGAAVVIVDEEPIAALAPGDVVGEFAVVDDTPTASSVTTTEQTTLWCIARSRFAAVAHRHPDMAKAMLDGLVARLRETNISLTALRPR